MLPAPRWVDQSLLAGAEATISAVCSSSPTASQSIEVTTCGAMSNPSLSRAVPSHRSEVAGTSFPASVSVTIVLGRSVACAGRVGVSRPTVGKWRSRFVEHRRDGLVDGTRPGRPATVTAAQVEDVVVATLESTPANATHWSRAKMADRTGLSPSAVISPPRTPAGSPKSSDSSPKSPATYYNASTTTASKPWRKTSANSRTLGVLQSRATVVPEGTSG